MDLALDEVFNQSGELNGYNLFSTHAALLEACADKEREALTALGARLGSAAMFACGDAANRNLMHLAGVFDAQDDEAASLLRRCFTPGAS